MAGLCEGGNEPPGSLKVSNYVSESLSGEVEELQEIEGGKIGAGEAGNWKEAGEQSHSSGEGTKWDFPRTKHLSQGYRTAESGGKHGESIGSPSTVHRRCGPYAITSEYKSPPYQVNDAGMEGR
ncbi:hypothetical protein ANN_11346, partial [Periplaneta americana]